MIIVIHVLKKKSLLFSRPKHEENPLVVSQMGGLMCSKTHKHDGG